MDKKIYIKIFDQHKNPMIEVKLEKVNKKKIEPILKEHFMINAFAEGWFSLFRQQLELKFKEIGAIGIQIERINIDESNQDYLNIHHWEIKDLGNSPLNKYID